MLLTDLKFVEDQAVVRLNVIDKGVGFEGRQEGVEDFFFAGEGIL